MFFLLVATRLIKMISVCATDQEDPQKGSVLAALEVNARKRLQDLQSLWLWNRIITVKTKLNFATSRGMCITSINLKCK